jgi:hypothetical protein
MYVQYFFCYFIIRKTFSKYLEIVRWQFLFHYSIAFCASLIWKTIVIKWRIGKTKSTNTFFRNLSHFAYVACIKISSRFYDNSISGFIIRNPFKKTTLYMGTKEEKQREKKTIEQERKKTRDKERIN